MRGLHKTDLGFWAVSVGTIIYLLFGWPAVATGLWRLAPVSLWQSSLDGSMPFQLAFVLNFLLVALSAALPLVLIAALIRVSGVRVRADLWLAPVLGFCLLEGFLLVLGAITERGFTTEYLVVPAEAWTQGVGTIAALAGILLGSILWRFLTNSQTSDRQQAASLIVPAH